MYRQIDASVEERFIDFFGEQSFTTDLGQRHIENFIAGRFNRNQVDGEVCPVSLQFTLGPVRLPQGKRTSASSKLEDAHCGDLMLKILRMMSTRSGPLGSWAICFSSSITG